MRNFQNRYALLVLLLSPLFLAYCSSSASDKVTTVGPGAGGSDIPNFMTGSMVKIPSSLTGQATLTKLLIDSDNLYLSRFNRISNIMDIVENARQGIEDHIVGGKSNFELIELNFKDTTLEIENNLQNYKSVVIVEGSGETATYHINVVTNDYVDTLSSVVYSKSEYGFKGTAIYNYSNCRYAVVFNQTNANYKTTTINATYDSSYDHISSVQVSLKEEGNNITVAGKFKIPFKSGFIVDTFSEKDEVIQVASSIDVKENVAQLYLAVLKSEDKSSSNPFEDYNFIDKVMDNEFENYNQQVLLENPQYEKQALVSVRDSIKVDEVTTNLIETIDESEEMNREDFDVFLSINRENSEIGLKPMFDFSQIEQPIYFNSEAKFLADENSISEQFKSLSADTISLFL